MADTYIDNVLRVRRDDATRTYTEYNSSGVQTSTRPYTAEENAALDAAIAAAQARSNRSAIETNLLQDLATMQTIIDTANATINASPASYIKDIARAIRRLDRMALAKFDGTT